MNTRTRPFTAPVKISFMKLPDRFARLLCACALVFTVIVALPGLHAQVSAAHAHGGKRALVVYIYAAGETFPNAAAIASTQTATNTDFGLGGTASTAPASASPAGTVNDFFRRNSYGKTWFYESRFYAVQVDGTRASYGNGYEAMSNEADAKITSVHGDNANNYDRLIYMNVAGVNNGLAFVGGTRSFYGSIREVSHTTVLHELGHNGGQGHATRAAFSNASWWNFVGTDGSSYSHPYDVMAVAAGDFGIIGKYYGNYLVLKNSATNDAQGLQIQALTNSAANSGTYRIYAHDVPTIVATNPQTTLRGLRIDREPAASNFQSYWLEFRASTLSNAFNYSTNPYVQSGLLVHINQNAFTGSDYYFTDTAARSRWSEQDGYDMSVPVGRTVSDPQRNLHLTPVARIATTPPSIDVIVNFGAFPGNQSPVLTTLTASTLTPTTGQTVTLTATATDADNDTLYYSWDFGDGTPSTTSSATQTKSWPTAGTYRVQVQASDAKGKVAYRSLLVNVGTPAALTQVIRGRVLSGGIGAGGVRVSIGDWNDNVPEYRSVLTDSDGTYAIPGVANGSWTVTPLVANSSATGTAVPASQAVTVIAGRDVVAGDIGYAQAGAADTLTVSPGTVVMEVGQSLAFAATKWTGGTPATVTGTSTWSTSGGGSFSGSTFTATTTGTWTITALESGLSGTATLTVTSASPTIAIASPANGAFFAPGTPIPLTAAITTNGNSIQRVEFWSNGSKLGDDADTAAPWTWTIPNPPAGTYTVFARVIETSGRITESTAVAISVSDLPPPWSQADVGVVNNSDTTIHTGANGGTFTITGFDGGESNFSFLHQTYSGDFNLVARFTPNGSPGHHRFLGLSARNTLASNSPEIRSYSTFNSPNFSMLWFRNLDGSTNNIEAIAPTTLPVWFKLERRGNLWRGARSYDGEIWTSLGTRVLALDASVKVGALVSSQVAVAITNLVLTPVAAGIPDITTQPVSTTRVVGQTASFSTTATGSALAYQWQRSNDAGSTWADVTGATASSYTTPALALSDNTARLRVVITNTAGSVTSDAALLTVTPPAISITNQPAAANTTVGGSATFTVAATVSGGGAVSYQWQQLPSGGSWADLPGATAASYTATNVQLAQTGSQFRCVVSSPNATSVTSSAASLNVLQQIQLWNMETNPGWTLGTSWQWDTAQGPGGAGIDPATAASGTRILGYNLTTITLGRKGDYANSISTPSYATTPAINTTTYSSVRLQFQRWLGIESFSFDRVAIDWSTNGTTWTSIYANPASTVQDSSWTLMSYDLPAGAAGAATLFIRWGMIQSDGSVTYGGWNLDDVAILGAPTNPNSPPVIVQQPAPQTVFVGQNATFTVQAAGTATLVYQWQRSNDGGSNWNPVAGATTASYTLTATALSDNAARFRCFVSNTQGNATSNSATLTVQAAPAAPTINTHPQGTTLASGQNTTLSVTATGTALTYQWYQGNSGNTASPISGATSASFTTPNLVATTSYWVRVSNPGGSADSNTATVNIGNTGSFTISPATVSAAEGDSGAQNLTFTVSRSGGSTGNVGVSYATVGGTATAGSDFVAVSSTLTWLSGDTTNRTFTVTLNGDTTGEADESFTVALSAPTGGATLANPSSATVTILNDDAIAAPTITGQPSNQTVSTGATATFTVTATGIGTLTYQWQQSSDGEANWSVLSSATAASYTTPVTVLGDNNKRYRCLVSNSGGSTASTGAVLTVTSGPLPTSWWKLDEGTGSNAADSTGGNNGTLTSGPSWSLGKFGQAVTLDGTDDHVMLANGSNLNVAANAAFTVTGWVRTTENIGMIFSFRHGTDDGAALEIGLGNVGDGTSNGTIKALVRQNSATSGHAQATSAVTVNNGAWRHFALTRTTGTIQLYVDGVASGSSVLGGSSAGAITTNLRAIGSARRWVQVGHGTTDERFLNGQVDDVRFFNGTALNAPQIQAIYNATAPSISGQPANQTVTAGGNAVFAVTANGTAPLLYQWLKNGSTLTNNGAIGGATTASLTLTGVQAADAGNYSLVVSSDYGTVTSSTAVLTVQTAYAAWLAGYPSLTGNNALATADPDGDGMSNLAEYALGGDPTSAASAPIPTAGTSTSGGTFLTLSFLRARSELTYVVQGSNDLVTWTDLATNPGTVNPVTPVTFTDTVNIPTGNPARRFLRLKVTSQ